MFELQVNSERFFLFLLAQLNMMYLFCMAYFLYF